MHAALGDRTLFPTLSARVYLNHAAISPPSLPVQHAIQSVVSDYATNGVGAVLGWVNQRTKLREELAAFIGAAAADIGFVANTSAGVTAIALGIPWKAGDRILLFRGEFPTNITPWQQAAKTFGLHIDMLPLEGFSDGSGAGLSRLEAHLKQTRTRLVAVSSVQFQTGLRMPVEAMATLCHQHGAELCVDAIQAIGATPFHVGSVDYVACGSHKWMMGVEGAGFVYIHPDKIDAFQPRVASWLSHTEGGMDFLFLGAGHLRHDRPIRRRADLVEGGISNSIGLAALHAGLTPIRALGADTIYQHIQQYHDALEPILTARGFVSERASDPGARSGILSVLPPAGHTAVHLSEALAAQGISTTTPDGRLRFSPHWPNSIQEVPLIAEALDTIVKTRE